MQRSWSQRPWIYCSVLWAKFTCPVFAWIQERASKMAYITQIKIWLCLGVINPEEPDKHFREGRDFFMFLCRYSTTWAKRLAGSCLYSSISKVLLTYIPGLAGPCLYSWISGVLLIFLNKWGPAYIPQLAKSYLYSWISGALLLFLDYRDPAYIPGLSGPCLYSWISGALLIFLD